LADLTLIAMEHRFVTANSKWFNHGRFLGCRYVDDLLIVAKNINDIIALLKEIYHEELTLEKTNLLPDECNFLDLSISIVNGVITSKIYNKTDDYNFEVMKYPHFESNIPRGIINNVIYGELLRFANGSSHIEDFVFRCKDTVTQLLKNSYPTELAVSIFKKASRKNCLYKDKFSISEKVFYRMLGL
jgi:hypothetical protein